RRHSIFSRDWSSDVCSSDLDEREMRDGIIVHEPHFQVGILHIMGNSPKRSRGMVQHPDGFGRTAVEIGGEKVKVVPMQAQQVGRSEERRGGKLRSHAAWSNH